MPDKPLDDVELISSYSRAEAIADGQLIDVTKVAREAGLRYPVALTTTVWVGCVEVPQGVDGQDEKGRLWDILVALAHAARSTHGDTAHFRVHVRGDNRDTTPPAVELKAICGPGDDAKPVITVMYADED